jgi:hypothetical protein
MREDTPYWKWATEINEYDPLMHSDEMMKHSQYVAMFGNVVGNHYYDETYTGNCFIAAGMGMRATGTPELVLRGTQRSYEVDVHEEVGAVDRMYQQYKNFVEDHLKSVPSHYEYLKENIYGGKDDHELN